MTDQFHRQQLRGIADRAAEAAKSHDGSLTVVIERNARPDERLRFEPRERPGPDWWRVEEVQKDSEWRVRGKEAVAGVVIEDERL